MPMLFEHDAQSADVWGAAQCRRSKDLAGWVGHRSD